MFPSRVVERVLGLSLEVVLIDLPASLLQWFSAHVAGVEVTAKESALAQCFRWYYGQAHAQGGIQFTPYLVCQTSVNKRLAETSHL